MAEPISTPLPQQEEEENKAGLLGPEEVTDLAKKLKSPESKVYLGEMKKLAESPEYQRSVPPDTTQTLKDAISKAEQLYQSRSTTNDWLEVAQTLGRAVAQFGAAQTGMRTGRDMSNLNFGPGIDYGARTDRAFREYQGSLKQAGDEADRTRQGHLDTETSKEKNFGKREDYLKSALKNAQEIEQDDARFKRTQALEAQKEKKAKEQSDLAERKFQEAELTRQETSLKKQLEAAQTLANTMVSDSDLTSKSRNKLQEKYGAQAARAGIDPEVLNEISESSKDEGVLGTGLFRGEDKTKKSQLVNQKVIAPIKDMLEAIQAKKKELHGGKAPVVGEQGKTEGSKQDPKIEQYAKQYNLDYDQAKKVLVGRGYKPAE